MALGCPEAIEVIRTHGSRRVLRERPPEPSGGLFPPADRLQGEREIEAPVVRRDRRVEQAGSALRNLLDPASSHRISEQQSPGNRKARPFP